MSGPFQVEQALQDPFSNLIQRAVLHEQLITLDVVGTPDYPVQPGVAGTLLFGTCKCTLRGQGMHLTIEDGSAISDAGGGAVRIRGTFRPVQTEADAFTLQRP